MPDRSYLFVPGNRPERFDKALQSGAHAVILDLEDAVLPEGKDSARKEIRTWLESTKNSVFIRVNAADTEWHSADCELLNHSQVRGVMLPKAELVEDLQRLSEMLRSEQSLLPLVESVEGWFQVPSFVLVPKVLRLAFGSFDFMLNSGIQGDGEELDVVRSHLVLHSRRAGLLAPIDGVSLATQDADQIATDVLRSRQYGFGAKLCIHPNQIPVVNSHFLPTQTQLRWAEKVVQALEVGKVGAVAVDGKLVDKPIALLAQSFLEEVTVN